MSFLKRILPPRPRSRDGLAYLTTCLTPDLSSVYALSLPTSGSLLFGNKRNETPSYATRSINNTLVTSELGSPTITCTCTYPSASDSPKPFPQRRGTSLVGLAVVQDTLNYNLAFGSQF